MTFGRCPLQVLALKVANWKHWPYGRIGEDDGEELVSVTQPNSGCHTEERGPELTATVSAVTHPEKTDNLTQTCGGLWLTLDIEVAQSQDAAEGWWGAACTAGHHGPT